MEMETSLLPQFDCDSHRSPSLCQIHNRYEGKDISNHKRNLVIAGGVTLSVIVSPVVAAVTVGQSNQQLSLLSCLQEFLWFNFRVHIMFMFVFDADEMYYELLCKDGKVKGSKCFFVVSNGGLHS